MNRGKREAEMENKLLIDLEDYLDLVEPGFDFVGEGDIEKISSIIGQNQYSNLIYAGRSGVGKTANLYGIIQKKKKTEINTFLKTASGFGGCNTAVLFKKLN